MEKRCFLKVSWQDPDQPLNRIHENIDEIRLDFTKAILPQILSEFKYTYANYNDFIVDFVLPLEGL